MAAKKFEKHPYRGALGDATPLEIMEWEHVTSSKGSQGIVLKTKKGDLFLWDSTTVGWLEDNTVGDGGYTLIADMKDNPKSADYPYCNNVRKPEARSVIEAKSKIQTVESGTKAGAYLENYKTTTAAAQGTIPLDSNNPPAPPKPETETERWARIDKKNDDREDRYVVRHEAMLDAMATLTIAIQSLAQEMMSLKQVINSKTIEVVNKSNTDKSFLQKVATEQIEAGKASLKNVRDSQAQGAKACAKIEADDLAKAVAKNEVGKQ
jgi:transcription antitermination factor NusA-like protein